MAWLVMVLLPKGGGDYRGIVLVEFVWHFIAAIINTQLKSTVNFCDTLHVF